MIKLGMKVRCKITGMEGIVFGITEWLYACKRVCVQPSPGTDATFPDTFTVDEPQLDILAEQTEFTKKDEKEPKPPKARTNVPDGEKGPEMEGRG